MNPAKILLGLPLLLAAGLLAGCISLLPESEPVQLYRFGESTTIAKAQTDAPAFTVQLVNPAFKRAAAGDRILTVNGTEAAYIKGARWVTSAEDLFGAALRRAFNDSGGPARLVDSGDVARAGYALKLQVHAFEARYTRGQDAAPDILVAMQATLTETSTRSFAGQRAFSVSITADDNRVGAIVGAFDRAVTQVTGELVAWVGVRGAAGETSERGP